MDRKNDPMDYNKMQSDVTHAAEFLNSGAPIKTGKE
jgi:hypothetical protein